MPLCVLREDDAIVALDKPAGLRVVPDRYDAAQPTLFNGVWSYLLRAAGADPADERALEAYKPRLVHRLDAGTSGVVLFAKTLAAQRELSRAFEEGQARKRYLALCEGRLSPPERTIELPLGPAPKLTRRTRGRIFAHPPGAKPALTMVREDEAFAELSLVEALPRTGRTHQIRVHLAAIGHPLAVDPLYGRRRELSVGAVTLTRLSLHAERLELLGYSLHAPLAADLAAVVAALRAGGRPAPGPYLSPGPPTVWDANGPSNRQTTDGR